MSLTPLFRYIATLLCICMATTLPAQLHTIAAKGSRLQFSVATKAPAKITGNMQPISGSIIFEPGSLKKAAFDVTVATASLATGDAATQAQFRSASLFNVATFPTLRFRSSSVSQDRPGSIVYIAQGNLTIKGVTKPAKLQFTVSPASKGRIFRGTAFISRTAYGIGEKGDMDELMTLYFEIRTN